MPNENSAKLPFDSRVSVGEITEKPWLAQQTIVALYQRLRSAEQSSCAADEYCASRPHEAWCVPELPCDKNRERFQAQQSEDSPTGFTETPCPIDYVAVCELIVRVTKAEEAITDDYRMLTDCAGQVVRLNALANTLRKQLYDLKQAFGERQCPKRPTGKMCSPYAINPPPPWDSLQGSSICVHCGDPLPNRAAMRQEQQ